MTLINRMTVISMLILFLVGNIPSNAGVRTDGALPEPGEIGEMRALVDRISQDKSLSSAGRAAVGRKCSDLMYGFEQVWAPLEASYEDYLQASDQFDRLFEDLNRRIDQHNMAQPTDAQLDAFNRRANQLNAEGDRLERQWNDLNDELIDRVADRADGVDAFLETRVSNFLGFLNRIVIGDSQAMRQLERIANGAYWLFDSPGGW